MIRKNKKDLEICLKTLGDTLYDVYMGEGDKSQLAYVFTFGTDAKEWADSICNDIRKRVKDLTT